MESKVWKILKIFFTNKSIYLLLRHNLEWDWEICCSIMITEDITYKEFDLIFVDATDHVVDIYILELLGLCNKAVRLVLLKHHCKLVRAGY